MDNTFDIEMEVRVLRGLIQQKKFFLSSFTYNTLLVEHFTEIVHRNTFNALKFYYKKYGNPPPLSHLLKIINRGMTRLDKYKSREKQFRIWSKIISKFYEESDDVWNLDADVYHLDSLRKARLIRISLENSVSLFEAGKYEEIIDGFSDTVVKSKKAENSITEGDMVEDFDEHVKIDEQIKSGDIRPLNTHMLAYSEKSNGEVITDFDVDYHLGGGMYKGEVVMFVGKVNVGKSFMLMETSKFAAKSKINSVLYTIEMQKVKQQRRLYSSITGIPYSVFKQGLLTPELIDRIRSKLKKWEIKFGKIYVVAFDEGATVMDLEVKHREIEMKYGEPFESMVVDYLNDLKPLGKYGSDKNWEAQGEISWGLAQLSKKYDNHQGLFLSTASQKKTTLYGKVGNHPGSAAFSPLPEHHATIVINIDQDEDDEIIGRIRFDFVKNREGEKGMSFYSFPNFKVSRIHSRKFGDAHYKIREKNNEKKKEKW